MQVLNRGRSSRINDELGSDEDDVEIEDFEHTTKKLKPSGPKS